MLPKCTNLSSYTIVIYFNLWNELKSMIEEFMIHKPKRLKPLKVIVKRELYLDEIVQLEEMLKNQSDLTS